MIPDDRGRRFAPGAFCPDTLFSVEHGAIVRGGWSSGSKRVDESKSTADAVSGFLSHVHEVSYATRLEELAGRAEELVPGVTGKPSKWKALVYEIRNRYAHQSSADWMEEDDLDRGNLLTRPPSRFVT